MYVVLLNVYILNGRYLELHIFRKVVLFAVGSCVCGTRKKNMLISAICRVYSHKCGAVLYLHRHLAAARHIKEQELCKGGSLHQDLLVRVSVHLLPSFLPLLLCYVSAAIHLRFNPRAVTYVDSLSNVGSNRSQNYNYSKMHPTEGYCFWFHARS